MHCFHNRIILPWVIEEARLPNPRTTYVRRNGVYRHASKRFIEALPVLSIFEKSAKTIGAAISKLQKSPWVALAPLSLLHRG
jgi:hypothetical protein